MNLSVNTHNNVHFPRKKNCIFLHPCNLFYRSLTALNFPPRCHFHTAKIDQNKKIEKIEKFSDISATLELTLQLRLFFQWFTGVKLRNFCFYTFPLSFEMAIFKNHDFDLKMLIIFFWRFLIKTSKSLFLVINVIHYLP